jgi:hypothetical protein
MVPLRRLRPGEAEHPPRTIKPASASLRAALLAFFTSARY